jgi:hypothetical protein
MLNKLRSNTLVEHVGVNITIEVRVTNIAHQIEIQAIVRNIIKPIYQMVYADYIGYQNALDAS